MATSTICPKCESTSFELSSSQMLSGEKIRFIQCSRCGAAITALPVDYLTAIKEIHKVVKSKL
ncbi:hypothetical protein HLI26_07355 [Salmonella enterica subsp. enterica]|uniref:hypothetical protein n=1 Tax=Salmonella enterica TaxID=28901 RepID=UPI0021516E3D|nr:hypothetical protein [Salmonella enterica]MCR6026797.1 hypothetical protein [Salmonella enterica subsp. enterica]